jgi:hypothetical protein
MLDDEMRVSGSFRSSIDTDTARVVQSIAEHLLCPPTESSVEYGISRSIERTFHLAPRQGRRVPFVELRRTVSIHHSRLP